MPYSTRASTSKSVNLSNDNSDQNASRGNTSKSVNISNDNSNQNAYKRANNSKNYDEPPSKQANTSNNDDESDYEDVELDSGGSSTEDDSSSEDEQEDSDDDNEVIVNPRMWCRVNMHNIPPPPPRFPFTGISKMTVNMDPESRPLDYFELFFDHPMLEMIVTQTNRFALQYINAHVAKDRSRFKNWTPTSEKEIRLFFSILMLQGIIKTPCQEWSWSKRPILYTPIFSKLLSRDRFCLLMKFIHFSDNQEFNIETHPNPKLYKLYEVMEHLRQKFCDVYIPEQSLSLDESLMLFKGRLGWKMFISKKRARFGLKSFVLCEAATGYICDFLLYTGNSTVYNPKYADFPISTKTVLHLMDRFLGQGYCVTVDNWYMSPQLADILVTKKTDIYGTLNKRRKDLPEGFSKSKLEKGKIEAFQRGKVMALKWQDKKTVCLMSTIHDATSRLAKVKGGEEVMKPTVVCDYNNTMGGVDRCDQELSYYPTSRKQQKKYYKKIFRHFIDQALWNSYILYTKYSPKKKLQLLEYRLQIIEQHIELYSDPNMLSPKGRPSITPTPLRLTARHFASHIPPNPIKKEPRRQCAVCCSKKDETGKKKRKETRIWCKECGVGLCLEPCFETYHTKVNY